MDRSSPARARLNRWLPAAYGMAIVLAGVCASGRAAGITAIVGGVLLGLYYGFARERGTRG